MPDLRLVDQGGAPITLRDLAGRVAIVTFIYTRCPLPDFCPLMVRHLESVRRRANEDGHGQPAGAARRDPRSRVRYARRAAGVRRIGVEGRRTDSTSGPLRPEPPRRSKTVARFFGVGYRAEGGFITHKLTTAVVGHEAVSCGCSHPTPGGPTSSTTSCDVGSSARRQSSDRESHQTFIKEGEAMEQWDRRRFISTAAVAAGSGLAGWHAFGSRGLLAQAPLAGVPDEILNPVEVSGAEAEPMMGKLPGPEAHVRVAGQRRRVSPRRQPGHEAHRAAGGHRRRSRARDVHRQHRGGDAAACASRAAMPPCSSCAAKSSSSWRAIAGR